MEKVEAPSLAAQQKRNKAFAARIALAISAAIFVAMTISMGMPEDAAGWFGRIIAAILFAIPVIAVVGGLFRTVMTLLGK